MSLKHGAPAPSQLSRERAVVLQKSLLEGYTAANFQKALAELERSQGALSCAFAAGRRALVRQVQAEVLPWHGYEASDEGARQMVVDFDQFRGDPVIQELSFQIDAALRCDSRGGLSRNTVLNLLQSMLDAFNTKEFQDRIQVLHLASNVSPEDDGFYLEGRAEAALEEQRLILPRFGLAPSRQGVLAMLSEVAKYANSLEVVRLLDEINSKLGMKPAACLRFRERLLSRWSSEDLSLTEKEATATSEENKVLARLSKVFEAGEAAETELLGVPTPPITKARAVALFSDLLMEFSSQGFQSKFQALLEVAPNKAEKDEPGRRDLVYKVYREVLPTYGFSADPPGLARLVQALQAHMEDPALLEKCEALEEKLHLTHGSSLPAAPTMSGAELPSTSRLQAATAENFKPAQRTTPSHSKGQILDLLSTMIARYESPAFQRRLAAVRCGDSPHHAHMVLKRMVRAVQVDVLPSFGFGANEEGMKEMSEAIGVFREDREVAALAACLDAALTGSSRPGRGAAAVAATTQKAAPPAARAAPPPRGGQVLPSSSSSSSSSASASSLSQSNRAAVQGSSGEVFSRSKLLTLLRKLSAEFGTTSFTSKIRDLKEAAQYDETDDFFYLLGRDELALAIQSRILPIFGLPGNRQGVDRLHSYCAQWALDAEVQELLIDMNRKLGMEPTAVRRWLEKLQLRHASERNLLEQALKSEQAAQSRLSRAAKVEQVKQAQGQHQKAAAQVAASTTAMVLSKGRASALLMELDLGLKAKKRQQQKLEEGMLPKTVREAILLEVLPRYGFPATDQGLRSVLEAVQQLQLEPTPEMESHRSAIESELLRGCEKPEAKVLDGCSPLSLEKAARLHDELLRAFAEPLFQKKLSELYRKHASESAEFAEQFGKLVSESMKGPLLEAGLSPSPEDLGEVFLALSVFFASDNAEIVLASIDEALFSWERSVHNSLGLGTVVRAWREQLVAFGRTTFQQALMKLKEQASEMERESGFFHLGGRAELALSVQKEVLAANGFDATPRDLQKLMAVTSTLTRVPLVSGLLDAVNAKLGMDSAARRRFRTRMGVLMDFPVNN